MARENNPVRHPPPLSARAAGAPVPRTALLLNPFYAKDPAGSFGKHVLAPSLALSSLAAVTLPEWSVRIWDENLLQGTAPVDPLPQVVGITVHLTFARRAFSLRSIWARRPRSPAAALPYLAMALLYKRCNGLWELLIRHRLTHAVWRPLVRLTRLRHLRFRRRLQAREALAAPAALPVPPGV